MTNVTFKFWQLCDPESSTYTYILADPKTREAVIIDPVSEQSNRDLAIIRDNDLKLLYIFETHLHADHITSSAALAKSTGAQIVLNAIVLDRIEDAATVKPISDGQALKFGQYRLQVLSTPGHTDHCLSYYCENSVFTGDTLLIGGCGRTDFQSGSAKALYQSVHKKLFVLPDSTLVYPAHDYNGRTHSSVGDEKKNNSRLGANKSEAEFIEIMNNLKLDLPKKINIAVPANLRLGK